MACIAAFAWAAVSGCVCGDGRACKVDDGRYYAFAPDGWDGEADLPVVVFFHGLTGSPKNYFKDDTLVSAFSDAGYLWVLPEGSQEVWTIQGMGLAGNGRDEWAFFDAVLADLKERWPVDKDRVHVAGFSLGGSMAYTAACYRGDELASVAAFSGGFWTPLPKACSAPATPFRHVHGLDDKLWPFEGRLVQEEGESGVQVPVDEDVAFWREHNRCEAASESRGTPGPLSCEAWADCTDLAEVELCTHDGGHTLREGWADRLFPWLARFE
jgi:polyhydroxybutyrate depolymerase